MEDDFLVPAHKHREGGARWKVGDKIWWISKGRVDVGFFFFLRAHRRVCT